MAIPKKEETIGGGGFGELWAGLHTPKETSLDPEVEANLRLRYSEALTLLARTENQYKTEVIESHSNILVSLMQAYARSMSAAASSAAAGAQSQRASAEMMKSLTGYFSTMIGMVGGNIPKTLATEFDNRAQALTGGLHAKNMVLLEQLKHKDTTDAAELISKEYADAVQNGFYNVVAPVTGTANRNATPGTRYHIKVRAQRIVDGELENAYSQLITQLKSSADPGVAKLGNELGRSGTEVVGKALAGGLVIGQSDVFNASTQERAAAESDRDVGGKFLKEHYEYARSLGAGIPSAMFEEFMTLYDVGKELADKGPEAYAEGLSKMPSPIEFDKAREILDKGLESLDPVDPLTSAMRGYIATVPGFYRWAAVMGFKNPLKAVDYAVKHPGDINSFLRIQQETGGDIPLTELQGRMRQEGVFQTTGPLGKKFLSKPLERLFGFGIRPSPGYQIFPGETDVDKLQGAIDFVNKGGDLDTVAVNRSRIPEPSTEDLPDEEEEAELGTRPTDEPLLPATATEKFLESLSPDYRAYLNELTEPEKKRALERFKRQAVAAKRKITGEKPPWPGLVEGRGEKRDTYDPLGEEGLPYAGEEEPQPVSPVVQPPTSPPSKRTRTLGTSWSKPIPKDPPPPTPPPTVTSPPTVTPPPPTPSAQDEGVGAWGGRGGDAMREAQARRDLFNAAQKGGVPGAARRAGELYAAYGEAVPKRVLTTGKQLALDVFRDVGLTVDQTKALLDQFVAGMHGQSGEGQLSIAEGLAEKSRVTP